MNFAIIEYLNEIKSLITAKQNDNNSSQDKNLGI